MTIPVRNVSAAAWPFRSVLIANRGEIALRIMRGVRNMGLEPVVVYHAVDADSPAVKAAERKIEITGRTPVAAYLDGGQIIAAAKATGAGAIHPGYGFLSENAGFARAVAAAGLTFVGPTPEAIELMGDKVRARSFVEKHGFPVAPSAIEDDDPTTFVERARAVGFPLLIKPSAGGGGKGMRVVREPSVLAEEIVRARSEGERYFGDGRLYVERYIENPHHIEVQVLGDQHGNVVHLFERECSVQRRFQKIIEETPSPTLTPQERTRICDTAAGIARAAGYRNAGTVEFIYGAGEFYFLEMNTRLQVEHPVTEEVTCIDLVREQLCIAAGEPLGFAQGDIETQGHAIECRIYAESPARGFAPTTGRILAIQDRGTHARLDIGVSVGQAITTAFDPMLAKIIVHGQDRIDARTRALTALKYFVLLGCETNIGFLRRLLEHPAFTLGDIHTGFIDAHPELTEDPEAEYVRHHMLAVAALAARPVRDAADAIPDPHNAMGGWRN